MPLPSTTYSVAFRGGSTLVYGADNQTGGATFVKNSILPDLNGSGEAVGNSMGGQHNTMSNGDVMLIKGPDGSIFVGEFDPEISRNANPVIRKKYG